MPGATPLAQETGGTITDWEGGQTPGSRQEPWWWASRACKPELLSCMKD